MKQTRASVLQQLDRLCTANFISVQASDVLLEARLGLEVKFCVFGLESPRLGLGLNGYYKLQLRS